MFANNICVEYAKPVIIVVLWCHRTFSDKNHFVVVNITSEEDSILLKPLKDILESSSLFRSESLRLVQ